MIKNNKMNYDNEYLKMLYDDNDLHTFLSKVNVDDITDPRKKAIISTLKRSIKVLHLEFNPIPPLKDKKTQK
jgi:hypothetical protein